MKILPLLTGTHRYEKCVSTYMRGVGEFIDAPILAYLIESPNGRVLFDVGCDYSKIDNDENRHKFFDPMRPQFDPPIMSPEHRLPHYLTRLGLSPRDIDLVFISHLHFDHVGGLKEFGHSEIQVQMSELEAARTGKDDGVFADELGGAESWIKKSGEYTIDSGLRAICTPGHTAGHMSLVVELRKGKPLILCGDAADLMENLSEEVAPGYCWNDEYDKAVASIRKLKGLAKLEDFSLWPNHDFSFFKTLPAFPTWIE